MTNSTMTYLSLLLTTIPIVGLIVNMLSNRKPKMGAQLATIAIGIGLLIFVLLMVGLYKFN